MSTLIPVHPSITELPDEDRDRLYLDDELRWVGPTAPSTRYVELCAFILDDAARRLSDVIVDDGPDEWLVEYRRRDYIDARARMRQLEAIERHRFAPGAEGFAGWIIR